MEAPRAALLMKSSSHSTLICFDTIFSSVWFRKTYHFAVGALLCAAVMFLPAPALWCVLLAWIALFGMISRRLSTVAVGVLVLSLLSGSRFTTVGATLCFVVGDGMSALLGSLLGGPRLPWNPEKTVAGSLAFWASSAVTLAVWLSVAPPGQRLALALLPTTLAALAESLPFAS